MSDEMRALCDAAGRGDLESVTQMVHRRPDLIHRKHEGATPLHFAALEGQDTVAEFLVQQGADLNVEDDEFGSPPAGWANEKGHAATVALLAPRNVRIAPGQAAAWGLRSRLEELIETDPASVNEEDGFGAPLHEAAIWGRTGIVSYLLDHGADAQKLSRSGRTALQLASEQAKNGRTHTPIVREERRLEIERDCAQIAEILARR